LFCLYLVVNRFKFNIFFRVSHFSSRFITLGFLFAATTFPTTYDHVFIFIWQMNLTYLGFKVALAWHIVRINVLSSWYAVFFLVLKWRKLSMIVYIFVLLLLLFLSWIEIFIKHWENWFGILPCRLGFFSLLHYLIRLGNSKTLEGTSHRRSQIFIYQKTLAICLVRRTLDIHFHWVPTSFSIPSACVSTFSFDGMTLDIFWKRTL
jgi:hypothetical protein